MSKEYKHAFRNSKQEIISFISLAVWFGLRTYSEIQHCVQTLDFM